MKTCPICGNKIEKKSRKTCSRVCAHSLQRITMGKSPRETHGFARPGNVERMHDIWRGMLRRCYSKNDVAYQWYGARGIVVCDEWKTDYVAFRTWYLSQDTSNGKTIDRINNDGPYSPDNCKLATFKEQARNRRSSRTIEYKGEIKTVAEWSELLQIPYARILARIDKLGWTVEQAFTLAVNSRPHFELM